jgi:hypothetical protein
MQLNVSGNLNFAEVQYYLRLAVPSEGDLKTLALVSVYSPPDEGLLKDSSSTLWSCAYRGNAALRIIDINAITSVVAMVPQPPFRAEPEQRYFVVEKPGLDVAHMGGKDEELTEE